MRTKLFIEEFLKNWIIIILGSVCLSIGFWVLYANEGKVQKSYINTAHKSELLKKNTFTLKNEL